MKKNVQHKCYEISWLNMKHNVSQTGGQIYMIAEKNVFAFCMSVREIFRLSVRALKLFIQPTNFNSARLSMLPFHTAEALRVNKARGESETVTLACLIQALLQWRPIFAFSQLLSQHAIRQRLLCTLPLLIYSAQQIEKNIYPVHSFRSVCTTYKPNSYCFEHKYLHDWELPFFKYHIVALLWL